jgi:hypothetical protein
MRTEMVKAVQSRHTINPKTVLGFYATVVGALLSASVAAIAFMADSERWGRFIPWILLFDAIVVLGLLIGVFIVTLIDPSKLMLTQVSGTEYAAIQRRVILGDSTSGEIFVEAVSDPPVEEPFEPGRTALQRPERPPVGPNGGGQSD